MALFCRIISLENAAEFPIFCRTLSEALIIGSKFMQSHSARVTMSLIQTGKIKMNNIVQRGMKRKHVERRSYVNLHF